MSEKPAYDPKHEQLPDWRPDDPAAREVVDVSHEFMSAKAKSEQEDVDDALEDKESPGLLMDQFSSYEDAVGHVGEAKAAELAAAVDKEVLESTDPETFADERVSKLKEEIEDWRRNGISDKLVLQSLGGFDEAERLLGTEYANMLNERANKELEAKFTISNTEADSELAKAEIDKDAPLVGGIPELEDRSGAELPDQDDELAGYEEELKKLEGDK